MTENRDNIEIDLKRLFLALWHRAWLILLVGVLVAAVAFGYAWFLVTPMYSASSQLYVNNTYGANSPGFSSSQLVAAQSLASTYMVILESRDVLVDVTEQTGLDYSVTQLRDMISAASVNETEVFEVTATCPDYRHAAMIANAIADLLPDKIASVVDGSSVRVVEYAVESDRQVSPDYDRYAILGFLLGCVLTAGVVVAMNIMDTSINSEEYLAQAYPDMPLLAVIPDAQNPKSGGYYRGNYESAQKKPSGKQNGGKK